MIYCKTVQAGGQRELHCLGPPGQQAAQPEDDCPLVLLTMIFNNSKDKRFPNYGRCVDGGR